MNRILLLSSGSNSLGQIAKHFFSQYQTDNLNIVSASLTTSTIDKAATVAMQKIDSDFVGGDLPTLSSLSSLYFDIVITINIVNEELTLPGNPELVNWQVTIDDKLEKSKEYNKICKKIANLVNDFFAHGYFQALTNAKLLSTLILDNVSDGIIAHDMQRRIFYFNKAAEQITGYNKEEVINRDCHEVFKFNFCGGKCHFCNDDKPEIGTIQQKLTIHNQKGVKKPVAMTIGPIMNGDKMRGVLVSFKDLSKEKHLARRAKSINSFAGIIGKDEIMLDVFDMIRDLADINVPVLIQGESGTGKELVASAIHNEGARANKLFVPVNCGALPEQLLESELFGHVRGAFTGAIRDKKGRFELADGGTIFLDEIGDISPLMQVKLLRVLQEGTLERVGSEKTIKVDVRVLSATHRDLHDEIAKGRFREDLFYRLSVVPLELPPLRDRRSDIVLLVDFFLKRLLKHFGKKNIKITPEALEVMYAYDWPGNIRELQNWLQYALVKCKANDITINHLPKDSQKISNKIGIKTATNDNQSIITRRKKKLTIDRVKDALNECHGNKMASAKLLGVGRATLYRFINDNNL